jgi:hypothetical protein
LKLETFADQLEAGCPLFDLQPMIVPEGSETANGRIGDGAKSARSAFVPEGQNPTTNRQSLARNI